MKLLLRLHLFLFFVTLASCTHDDNASSSLSAHAILTPTTPTAYLTTSDLQYTLSPQALPSGAGNSKTTITVDTSTRYQSMVGFGASLTDSSSFLIHDKLHSDARSQVLQQLFDGTQGIGLTFLRQPMGASDFSTVGNFSYDDNPPNGSDAALQHFSIAQDMKATVPVLQSILAINPNVTLTAVPWSPPAWMKTNNSMDGSAAGGTPDLAGASYDAWAQYFVHFLQAYADQGLPITAVMPQNEPLFVDSPYPGMSLTDVWETSAIRDHLGPALQAANLSTQVWAYDHNWDNESYPETVMADSTAADFTEGAAFHCYAGAPSAMSTFHNNHPDKSIYMTECSGGSWQDDPWADTIDLVIDSTANYARAISLWNLALDTNNGPQNNGCSGCRGVITIDQDSGDVTYNADYYALGHFSKFVSPGATRVDAQTSNDNLNVVAFQNPDNSMALVVHNTGDNRSTFQISQGKHTFNFALPANAAATLIWQP